jgi:ribosome-binding protein aMBF1 (putative translation factor)
MNALMHALTNSADVALVALVSVVSDIERGNITATEDDREALRRALEILATLGEENDG